jgi:hypothetical protein
MGAFLSHLRRRGTSIGDINPVLVLLFSNIFKSGCFGIVTVPPDVEIRLSIVIAVVTIRGRAGREGMVCAMLDVFVLVASDGSA